MGPSDPVGAGPVGRRAGGLPGGIAKGESWRRSDLGLAPDHAPDNKGQEHLGGSSRAGAPATRAR